MFSTCEFHIQSISFKFLRLDFSFYFVFKYWKQFYLKTRQVKKILISKKHVHYLNYLVIPKALFWNQLFFFFGCIGFNFNYNVTFNGYMCLSWHPCYFKLKLMSTHIEIEKSRKMCLQTKIELLLPFPSVVQVCSTNRPWKTMIRQHSITLFKKCTSLIMTFWS